MLRCEDTMVSRDGFQLGPVNTVAAAGEVTAVIGPNASGKTTLLETVAGVAAPSQGVVMLEDRNVHQLSAAQRASRVSMLPQRPASDVGLTVERLVELGRLQLSRRPEAVDAALGKFELDAIRHRPLCTLSVGQAQRVHLARLWAQRDNHSLLVLDEPTAPLDHRWSDVVWDLLSHHARGGGAVVVAVHDLAVAAARADAVWLIKDGSVTHAGPVGEVMQLDVLGALFETSFEWVVRRDGTRWLVRGS
jgi:iron complex transport system ATP-binding protein